MSLLKTSVWSAVIVIVGAVVGFVSQKLYAVYTGAEGLLAIGNFNNFASMVYVAGSGGIYAGIVKTIASASDKKEQQLLLRPVFDLLLFFSLATMVVLFLTDQLIYSYLYKGLGVSRLVNFIFYLTLPFIILSNGILYVMNGRKQIRKYAIISIAIHCINLLLTWILVKYALINGALFSLFLPGALGFFLMMFFARENFTYPKLRLKSLLKNELLGTLIGFSAVSVLSIVLLSLSQLVIRGFVLKEYSVEDAGNWQALSNISKIWMAVVTGVLSMYFYPMAASLPLGPALKSETRKLMLAGIPVLISALSIVFILRNELLCLVYSSDFEGGASFMIYQLVGDFFKSIGIAFGYIFLAKGYLKPYAFAEVTFTIVYIALSIWLGNLYGMNGVFAGYVISYLLYLLIQLWVFIRLQTI